jgi:hypothetical protein
MLSTARVRWRVQYTVDPPNGREGGGGGVLGMGGKCLFQPTARVDHIDMVYPMVYPMPYGLSYALWSILCPMVYPMPYGLAYG